MTTPAPFRLNDVEKMSPLWQRLHAHLVTRLADKRRANDGPHLDSVATAHLRGEIKALKYLTDEIVRSPTEFAAGES